LERLATLPFSGRTTMAELLNDHRVPLKRQAVRIVISDFLFPHDPASLIRRLATDSSALWLVQLLSSWEAAPTPQGGRHLVDIETAGETDLVLDRRALETYPEPLSARHQ